MWHGKIKALNKILFHLHLSIWTQFWNFIRLFCVMKSSFLHNFYIYNVRFMLNRFRKIIDRLALIITALQKLCPKFCPKVTIICFLIVYNYSMFKCIFSTSVEWKLNSCNGRCFKLVVSWNNNLYMLHKIFIVEQVIFWSTKKTSAEKLLSKEIIRLWRREKFLPVKRLIIFNSLKIWNCLSHIW